jgi:hypothetical protein
MENQIYGLDGNNFTKNAMMLPDGFCNYIDGLLQMRALFYAIATVNSKCSSPNAAERYAIAPRTVKDIEVFR